eukprot:2500174-Rhodomonas_salina.1
MSLHVWLWERTRDFEGAERERERERKRRKIRQRMREKREERGGRDNLDSAEEVLVAQFGCVLGVDIIDRELEPSRRSEHCAGR